jgi:hypothetical protein
VAVRFLASAAAHPLLAPGVTVPFPRFFPAPGPRPVRALAPAFVTALLVALSTALSAGPATASSTTTPAALRAATLPRAATASPTVESLTLPAVRVHVAVARVHRTGQVQWITHVLYTRLMDLGGCQARRTGPTWTAQTYRTDVLVLCQSGTGQVRSAVSALQKSRPWYKITTTNVPLVGFSLLADLPSGNDAAVPAALAELPSGPLVLQQGDDVSLEYAGPGVTQAQMDAARRAFAAALKVSSSSVAVAGLFG